MANILDPVTNFAEVTASTGYDNAVTSVVLSSGDGAKLPAPATDGAFNLAWFDSTTYMKPSDDPNKEIVRVTARTTDTLTISRAQEGTSAATHNTGGKTYKLVLSPSKKLRDDIENALKAKLIDAAPASDHSVSGVTIQMVATQNVAFGDVCYIASTGKLTLIDADAIASMSGLFMCADATINADATGNWLVLGIARDDTWNWTVGGIIYGTVTGTSGNTLSQTAVSGTDDVVQILGVATHADRMMFNPQLVQIELV